MAKKGPPGSTLRPEHFDDFAAFCGEVAARYPDVLHFLVWNEMDGFRGGGSFDAHGYTQLFVKVSTAVKKVNPRARVGGPYVPISAGQLPPGAAGAVSGAWGAVSPAVLELIEYFLDHAVGHYDFVTLDGHLAYNSTRLNGTTWRPPYPDALSATGIFPAVTSWTRRALTARGSAAPIWWSEMYPVPCFDYNVYMPGSGGEPPRAWPIERQIEVCNGRFSVSGQKKGVAGAPCRKYWVG